MQTPDRQRDAYRACPVCLHRLNLLNSGQQRNGADFSVYIVRLGHFSVITWILTVDIRTLVKSSMGQIQVLVRTKLCRGVKSVLARSR